MQARYYDPVIGRLLSNDPVGFAEGGVQYFNRYAFVANNPVNAIDPTGMYGRGSGFTDDEWGDFDAAQQQAAGALEAKAGELSGAGSGTAENLTSVSGALAENATALRDDGSSFRAHQVTTAQLDAAFPGTPGDHSSFSAAVPVGQFSNHLLVNADHPARFAQSTLKHEPNHHFGRSDERQQWC